MAEINNALALYVKPAQTDLATPMLTAAKLREADASNALAQLQIENTRLQMGDAAERRNALATYKTTGDVDTLRGQPDLQAQIVQIRGQLDDQTRKRWEDGILKNARAAQRVAGITDPAERAAAWKEELDTARAEKRITDGEYSRLSRTQPNALVLDRIIRSGLTIQQQIELEQKDKDRQLGRDAIAAVAPILGGSAPAAIGPQASAQPRGLRNNNPLNIEAGRFTEGLPGFAGSDGRFARFKSMEDGIAAADRLLVSYAANQGIDTVQGVINRWAPASENDTSAYANSVAKALGIKPTDKIDLNDPGLRKQLIGAMAQVENGRAMPGSGAMPTSIEPGSQRLVQALPQLQTLRMTPGLPESVAKGLDGIIEHARKLAEPTGEMKEYELYVQQETAAGRTPDDFTKWTRENKASGRTSVTQVNRGEDAYDRTMGETMAKRYVSLTESGDKAFATLGSLAEMRRATEDPSFYSGTMAESVVLPLKQLQVALGGDPKAAASMENFRALANKAALDGMGGSLGTGFSNADRDFIVTQYPQLPNTPEGNRMRIIGLEKIERRKIDVARMAQEYVQETDPKTGKPRGRLDAGFDRRLSEWREKNPIFSEGERGEIKQLTEAALPKSGDIVDGWRFKGGDRSKRENWERVQ